MPFYQHLCNFLPLLLILDLIQWYLIPLDIESLLERKQYTQIFLIFYSSLVKEDDAGVCFQLQ